jgi:hypothetical protein
MGTPTPGAGADTPLPAAGAGGEAAQSPATSSPSGSRLLKGIGFAPLSADKLMKQHARVASLIKKLMASQDAGEEEPCSPTPDYWLQWERKAVTTDLHDVVALLSRFQHDFATGDRALGVVITELREWYDKMSQLPEGAALQTCLPPREVLERAQTAVEKLTRACGKCMHTQGGCPSSWLHPTSFPPPPSPHLPVHAGSYHELQLLQLHMDDRLPEAMRAARAPTRAAPTTIKPSAARGPAAAAPPGSSSATPSGIPPAPTGALGAYTRGCRRRGGGGGLLSR